MPNKINILIIDEQVIVAQGLQRIIDESLDLRVVGEAHNAADAMHIAKNARISIFVFDPAMKNGSELLLTLRNDFPYIPILILSLSCENETSVRWIRQGAAGCLCKTSSAEDLIAAIRKIHASGKFISETVALHLADQVDNSTSALLHTLLSEREFQVFKRLSNGIDNKELAVEMFLSPKTVSTYKKRVLEKLKCKNNSELTRYALAQNVL